MKWRYAWLVILLPSVLAYLLLWPVPIQPITRRAPRSTGCIGPHVRNDWLATARIVSIAPEVGPEHIAFGPDGGLHTGTPSGPILRMGPDGAGLEHVVNTGRRLKLAGPA